MSIRTRSKQAFTIVELTVSVALAAVISGATYLILHHSTSTNKKVENKTEAVQSANLALEAIKRDIRQLVTRPFIYANGKYSGIVGDAQHPVLIGERGTEMSFHIPDPASTTPDAGTGKYKLMSVYYGLAKVQVKDGGHTATVYHLVRVESNKPNLPIDAGTHAFAGNVNLGAIYLREGKDANGNPIAPIQFKLLGPNSGLGAGSPSEPSGDNNYYLQISLFGADGAAFEEQPRNDLNVLDVPSRMASVPGIRVNEFTLFEPNPAPLFLTPQQNPPQITDLPLNLGNPQNPGPAPSIAPPPSGGPPPNPNPSGSPSPSPSAPPPPQPSPSPSGGPSSPPPPPPPPAPTPAPSPSGTPTAGGPNLPPGVDPKGAKSWSSFYAKDSSGNITVQVEAVLHNDGTLTFTQKDGSGKVIDSITQGNTPQGAGQNAAQASVDAWLTSKGIDPKSVRNDPTIQPPKDYGT